MMHSVPLSTKLSGFFYWRSGLLTVCWSLFLLSQPCLQLRPDVACGRSPEPDMRRCEIVTAHPPQRGLVYLQNFTDLSGR